MIRFTVFRFQLIALLVTLSGCSNEPSSDPAPTSTTQTKPNFIFIFADDQAPGTIAAHGNAEIHTPNLDVLAKQGLSFHNAHNMGAWNGAVCQASRAMINSGLSLWQAHEQSIAPNPEQNIDQSWAKQLEHAGYDTYFSGKWHVTMPVDKTFKYSKNVRPGMPPDGWEHADQVALFEEYYSGSSKYKHYSEFMPIGYNRPLNKEDDSWSPSDAKHGGFYDGGKHWSEIVKDDAIEFLGQAKSSSNPFFMYLAFNAPHDPRQAPQTYQDMYDSESLTLPKSWQTLYPNKEAIGNGPDLRDAALAPHPRTDYATRVHIKEYYAIISHLDTQIGLILDELKAQGLDKNTYIFFTADHGLAVGEHGLLGKQNMYAHSVRAPFIVVGPEIAPGTSTYSDTYIQDILPTTLDLAGIEIPETVFFKSLTHFFTGTKSNTHEMHYDAIYGAYIDFQRMVKKDNFKLIVYPNISKLKLFDLSTDPEEMYDLYGQPEYEEKTKELKQALLALQKEMNDPLDIRDLLSK